MRNVKICLVEDQELVRKSLAIVLGMEEGIEVLGTAGNGEQGIELCEKLRPDVALMDIHMPVMDGVTAAKELKTKWPEMKVVMLTTFSEIGIVEQALQIGAEGYVLKDIDPRDLASAIRLIHAGETMIPQHLAKQLFERLSGKLVDDGPSLGSKTPVSNWTREYGITDRELEVLRCLADGMKNRDIAGKLYLSDGSVRNYISSIYSKMGVANRTSAIRKFRQGP